MSCEKCLARRESPLHFITQCPAYSDLRLVMLNEVKNFIPKMLLLPKKRQYEILVFGYDPENNELLRYNNKIMMATQNYIYDTKRFCYQNKPPVPPLVQPLPPHNPLPAPTIEIIHSIIYYCTVFDRIKNDFG